MIFYYMILAHLLYDFHWQGQFIGTYKSKYKFILFIHSLTYAMFVGLPYIILMYDVALSLSAIGILLVTHYFIDSWKCNDVKKNGERFWLVYVDQALHLAVLIIVYFLFKFIGA